MENKINIAKLLKDCPTGMELDCTMYENTSFIGLTESVNFPIRIRINFEDAEEKSWTREISLTSEGKLGNHPNAKCIIFPKGKTTWEGFHRPFRDGDIVAYDGADGETQLYICKDQSEINHCCLCYLRLDCDGELDLDKGWYYITRFATEEEKVKLFKAIKNKGYRWNSVLKTLEKLPIFNDGDIIYNRFHKVIGIYHSKEDESHCVSHCRYNEFHKTFEILNEDLHIAKQDYRLASNDEKQKFFDVIKAHGYKWNPEVKTLEKLFEPKFKAGDRVKHVSAHTPGVVLKVGDKGYYIDLPKNGGVRYISFTLEKDYELTPNKFDINTLVPFEDKVLVRNAKNQRWIPAFWGYKVADGFVTTFGWCKYCIPYKGNEILFKTNNDCDDYFKTWQK